MSLPHTQTRLPCSIGSPSLFTRSLSQSVISSPFGLGMLTVYPSVLFLVSSSPLGLLIPRSGPIFVYSAEGVVVCCALSCYSFYFSVGVVGIYTVCLALWAVELYYLSVLTQSA